MSILKNKGLSIFLILFLLVGCKGLSKGTSSNNDNNDSNKNDDAVYTNNDENALSDEEVINNMIDTMKNLSSGEFVVEQNVLIENININKQLHGKFITNDIIEVTSQTLDNNAYYAVYKDNQYYKYTYMLNGDNIKWIKNNGSESDFINTNYSILKGASAIELIDTIIDPTTKSDLLVYKVSIDGKSVKVLYNSFPKDKLLKNTVFVFTGDYDLMLYIDPFDNTLTKMEMDLQQVTTDKQVTTFLFNISFNNLNDVDNFTIPNIVISGNK